MEIQKRNEQVQSVGYEDQVDVAKRYPRDIMKAIQSAKEIATMDKETAGTCGYTLPRAGKQICGPSVHLAKIIAQCYTNLRFDSRVVEVTESYVVAEAVAFDLENNIASKREERKSIVGKYGRYKEDMIVTTGKATMAIALRNVIFDIVPVAITNNVYKASLDKLTGDLKNEADIKKRRTKAIGSFKKKYEVEESEILKALGLKSVEQIDQEQITILLQMFKTLKDGIQTVDEMFDRNPEAMEEPKLKTNEKPELIQLVNSTVDEIIAGRDIADCKELFKDNPGMEKMVKDTISAMQNA